MNHHKRAVLIIVPMAQKTINKKQGAVKKMKRTDIKQHDVFISWTGRDQYLKNQIVEYLRAHDIRCLESDENCSGDFRQWSREAVGACSIFLLIMTENTLESEYVPIEVEEYKKLEEYENRIVPVVSSLELYQNAPWGISEYGSAVILDGHTATEEHLKAILRKTESLIINLLDRVYKKATEPDYMKLIPLYKTKTLSDAQYDYSALYIPRTLAEVDENRNVITDFTTTAGLIKSSDILFICGAAGSGKTRYIDQIRKDAQDDAIVISLSCHKLSDNSEGLFAAMYEEFHRVCGNRYFYTTEDFKSLLNSRRLVVILDGMDEISTEAGTRKLLSTVEDYYRANSDGTSLVFTSRNENDAKVIAMNGKTVRRFMLEKLNEDEIRSLGNNLFSLFGSQEKSEAFYERIKDLNDEIRTNPLLLSQMAIVYEDLGEIPKTVAGIYDAISEITLKLDRNKELSGIPESYFDMVTNRMMHILKAFSKERYTLLSNGRSIDVVKIFVHILKERYGDESGERAEFLVEYLHNRAILVDGEFYHKMFLEYFTAVAYYEQVFDEYDEIENEEALRELFEQYSNPYWSTVISLFLTKADSKIDAHTTEKLYKKLLSFANVLDYVLLFDTVCDIERNREAAQTELVYDILYKSAEKVFPPYGPLFYYVPEYNLYKQTVKAASLLSGNARALALVRDVCFIFGQYDSVRDVTENVDAAALFNASEGELSGVRRALCELFYIGETSFDGGTDIYPRCFNVAEAKSLMQTGCGLWDMMTEPFVDELSLYEHENYNELNGELIGFVACPYHKKNMEKFFNQKSMAKVFGLALSPTINIVFTYISIYRKRIKVLYFPENCTAFSYDFDLHIITDFAYYWQDGHLAYARRKKELTIPGFLEDIIPFSFRRFVEAEKITVSEGVKRIDKNAFSGCKELRVLELPESLEEVELSLLAYKQLHTVVAPKRVYEMIEKSVGKSNIEKTQDCPDNSNKVVITLREIVGGVINSKYRGREDLKTIKVSSANNVGESAFEDCVNLVDVKLPNELSEFKKNSFKNCHSLVDVMMPNTLAVIGESAFENCTSLWRVFLPDSLQIVEEKAFKGCTKLSRLFLADNMTTIKSRAFENCISLKNVHLPPKIQFVASDAFAGCTSIKTAKVPVGFVVPEGLFADEVEISCYFPTKKKKKTPEILEQSEVPRSDIEGIFDRNAQVEIVESSDESLYRSKYVGCAGITSLVVSDGVTKISDMCFKDCVRLSSIELPLTLQSIYKAVFSGCEALESITIPFNTRLIGNSAFENCINLRDLKIYHRMVRIGHRAFYGCKSLEHINIPVSVRRIGKEAFAGCTGLKSVTISANFKENIEYIFGDIDYSIITFVY